MPAFFEFLRNITYYLVFMAIVGVVAPSGQFKKYIALVMGIMLIGVVIGPVAMGFGREPVPIPELFGNISFAPNNTVDAEHWHREHIQSAFHSQLTIQTEALLLRNGFKLISADWETSEDFTNIRRVSLVAKAIETTPSPTPFIRVEPVRIAPYRPVEETEETEDAIKVKKLISDFYNMSLDNIHVKVV